MEYSKILPNLFVGSYPRSSDDIDGLKDAGITPILFKQPWNRESHPFIEVNDWQEMEALIQF